MNLLDDAQTWTIIGAFITFMFGALAMVWYSFTRVLRGEIGGLRGELTGQIGELRGELTGQIGELRGEMRGELRALTVRVDSLDQDVQKLVERHFRDG